MLMVTTRELLALLRVDAPQAGVTEDRIRHVIRLGLIPRPRLLAGRMIWSREDIARLMKALGLPAPSSSTEPTDVN
jgi:hypothetical protein